MSIPALLGPLEVTSTNRYIDYRVGITLYQSSIATGEYSSIRAVVDAINTATSVNGMYCSSQVVDGSLKIKFFTISQNLEVLFSSGVKANYSVRDLVGYKHKDYTGYKYYYGDYQAQGCWLPTRVPATDTGFWVPKIIAGKQRVSLSGSVQKQLIAATHYSRNLSWELLPPEVIWDDESDERKNRTFCEFYSTYKGSTITYYPDRESSSNGVECWLSGDEVDLADEITRPYVDVEAYNLKIKLIKKN